MALQSSQVIATNNKLKARYTIIDKKSGAYYMGIPYTMLETPPPAEINAILHELEYILRGKKLNSLKEWSVNRGCYSTMYKATEEGFTYWIHLYWEEGRIDVEKAGKVVESAFLGDPSCFDAVRKAI